MEVLARFALRLHSMSTPNPIAPPKALYFRCPICRSQRYEAVVVRARTGKPYQTEFFECAGCSVMFRDPPKFTRFEPHAANTAMPDFKRTWIAPATLSTKPEMPPVAAPNNPTKREAKRAARLVRS
jgi:uncharacterized C2H2 Zn-finger protein